MAFNNEIEEVKAQLKVLEKKLSFLEELEKTKSPVEEAYKDWWGIYPELENDTEYDDTRWQGFRAGYEFAYEEKVKETAQERGERLHKDVERVVNKMLKKWEENPPDFLKFEMGKTLEELITRWWCDVFTTREDWDMETAIDDLIDQIQLWLPREQSHEGTQDASAIDLVDGYNDCLEKIKSKLRNKR
jgi:hypothetical protein